MSWAEQGMEVDFVSEQGCNPQSGEAAFLLLKQAIARCVPSPSSGVAQDVLMVIPHSIPIHTLFIIPYPAVAIVLVEHSKVDHSPQLWNGLFCKYFPFLRPWLMVTLLFCVTEWYETLFLCVTKWSLCCCVSLWFAVMSTLVWV